MRVAQQRIQAAMEDDCRADIGGDEQRLTSTDTSLSAVTFKLVLLPVWLLCYLHAGRAYQVAVNARTGEVIGQRPYSAGKIAAVVAAAVAVVALIVVLFALRSR
jgi:hypothetical protein